MSAKVSLPIGDGITFAEISPPHGGRAVHASFRDSALTGPQSVPPALGVFFNEIFAPAPKDPRTRDVFRRYDGSF